MTLYIGVDFHPHQQTVAWCDTETGETGTVDLLHDGEAVQGFFGTLPGPAVVGIEASNRAAWFEKMLFENGHELFVGNPVLIRKRAVSRHKSDRRDSELILGLLLRGEFPAIWRRPAESAGVIEVLGLRQSLVRQRTQVYNRLQALAHNAGLPKGRMRTLAYRAVVREAVMDETAGFARTQLLGLAEELDRRIAEAEVWLKRKAGESGAVRLLMTQSGVGYLTALATVHTLGDVRRFGRLSKQVAAFAGLDPVERSSAGKVRFGSISKAGSPLLRYHLVYAAHIAARFDARLKSFYKRLAKRKTKAVAKTAAARKLLVKLAIMLRDNITAEEFDLRGTRSRQCPSGSGSEMTAV